MVGAVEAVDGGGERRLVGRERVGGRRWRSLESASAAAADVMRWFLDCAEGVGGGAAVAPYKFGKCCCCL